MWCQVTTWRRILALALVLMGLMHWSVIHFRHRHNDPRNRDGRGLPAGAGQRSAVTDLAPARSVDLPVAEGGDQANPADAKGAATPPPAAEHGPEMHQAASGHESSKRRHKRRDKRRAAATAGDESLNSTLSDVVKLTEIVNFGERDTSNMQDFFFPATYQADWRPEDLKLGPMNFLVYAGEFNINGAIPGNVTTGQRAMLKFKLWRNTTLGDGANFHGQAATVAQAAGVGTYKFPPEMIEHLPEEAPRLRYSSCAVVGNSGVLLQGELGAEIDAHDAVIRMNAAPIKGFEKHVGRVTSYGFLNHVHFKRLATGNFERARIFASDKGRLVVFESMVYQAYFRLYNELVARFPPKDLALLIVSPDFASATYELWTRISSLVIAEGNTTYSHTKPSTGWFAMVFAAQMCDEVNLYGFEAYEAKVKSKSPPPCHYFDSQRCFTNVHSFELSVKVFQRLRIMGFNVALADPVTGRQRPSHTF